MKYLVEKVHKWIQIVEADSTDEAIEKAIKKELDVRLASKGQIAAWENTHNSYVARELVK